ncbi:nicotinamide N-methyltransferase-like [Rhineura floridana]|uniref:nicotinamide N-methyltransferase-like n=1 Tax=Rhineura floridana TaxID=261503 RepID=UPI002AC88723|nr:nicotinamide N-methyltransferase-like [Rhineura floridana]XP_061448296.1 nicotinamide N-methyltransferase-like [Rhineura floridana]XP_061448297.1 nicotinamide N-methyltransferase-like [Rhineura floridana]
MAEFTGGDVYQAEFDPKAYLEYFKFGEGTLGDEVLEFVLGCFCKTFTSGRLKGETLIDIGSGPTIYQLLSACESFESIIASDYVDQNCQEIEKWLKNEPGAFDWTPVVKYVCKLEGKRDKWAEKEAKLRRTIKGVLKCDVHQSNPMGPSSLPQADCLLSAECLESACKDLSSFRAALKNISSLLKLGGHLVLSGVLGCTFYMVGPRTFSSLFLTEEFLREALGQGGFAITEFEMRPRIDKTMMETSDFSAGYFIVACKEKEA